MANRDWVKVWDPFVRVFHWTLVVAFFVAYFTEGEPEWLHNWAGYIIAILLVARVVWGFIGSEHARFSDFVRSPSTVMAYLKENVAGRAKRYIGHNPAGGIMIVLILASLLITTGSGMVLLAAEEGEGPLAGWLITAPAHVEGAAQVPGMTGEQSAGKAAAVDEEDEEHEEHGEGHGESPLAESMEEVHEFFANFTLFLVIVHILAVFVESVRHRENLPRSMVTGLKRREED